MATFAYLALDSDYDPILADNTSLVNADAVQQAILTRLKLFYGEWWEDLTLGLPVFQSMLGQLGSQKTLNAIQLAVQQNIAGTPYVTSVTNVSVSFENGQFAFTANAQTQFGQVEVQYPPPGLSASLDG